MLCSLRSWASFTTADVPLYGDIIRKKFDEKKRFRFNEIRTLEDYNDDDPVIKLFSFFNPCSSS